MKSNKYNSAGCIYEWMDGRRAKSARRTRNENGEREREKDSTKKRPCGRNPN